ncbi:hypothetical protein F5B21DRAFT_485063 [Xylaria acuta]|nr:hypothetical protein F5B21DRAFT_485063 [Xylaria acuta]
MDPFTALSLAGNIVQFIEFGIKLTIKGSEIYSSVNGQSQADNVIREDTTRLLEFSEQLDRPLSSKHSESEAAVASLAKECAVEACKLRLILYGLQGLTLGEKVKVILEDPTYKTDAQKLQALSTEIADPTDAKKLSDILGEYHSATDAQRIEAIRKRLPAPNNRKKAAALVAALKSLWKKKEVEEIYNNLKEYRAQLTASMVGVINDKNSSITTLLETLVESNSLANKETSNRLNEVHTTLAQVRALIEQAARPRPSADIIQSTLPSQLHYLVKVGNTAIGAVLESLKFESMYAREANVSAAHSKTFKWLFDEQSDFYQWLSVWSGTFWVSGKPGSGKSTLMKFVSQHTDCQAALRTWAKGELLITASFYFWSSGTPMQKSLQGLLQSVLCQIMKACPLLIPIIAPDRWANALEKAMEDPWTWDEAIATLDRFIRQSDVKCLTCLFIDGLDEFEGDQSEMVQVFTRISGTPNIKICLASRPYNVFVDAYGQVPDRMIRLQDLTREDIRRYVHENFETHSSISRISIHNDQYSVLVEDIVNKAEGVFLWVYLVVRSLKDGFTNADTISKLQKRLQNLPSDLSEYFTHILNSVDQIYWEDTAKVFQMVVLAQHPLPPGVLSVLDEEEPDYCIKVGIQQMPVQEYEENIRIIERRLNARCKGLLEIRATPGHMWGGKGYHDRYLVYFLHRTVRDFLRNEDVLSLLRSRLSGSFNVDLILCQGYLLQLKRFIIRDDPLICKELSFTKSLDDLSYFAQRHEKIFAASPVAILDEALRAARKTREGNPNINEMLVYSTIVRHSLSKCLEHRLQMNPELPRGSDKDLLLEEALTSASAQSQGSRYDCILQPSVVEILLKYGAKANGISRSTSGETVWKSFVAYMRASRGYVTANPDEYYEASVLLLNVGAERSRRVKNDLKGCSFPPPLTQRLEQLLVELDTNKRSPTPYDPNTTVARGEQPGGSSATQVLNHKQSTGSSNPSDKKVHVQEFYSHAEGTSQAVTLSHDQTGKPTTGHGKPGSRIGSKLRQWFKS